MSIPQSAIHNPKSPIRLGIFGGSFDPVHHGHLVLADCCCEQARLDEVWLVPAAYQPLKPHGPVASDADRLAMLQFACGNFAHFSVSTIELERGGVSYTIDTLETIRRARPEAKLFFLMGADSLADLPAWHRPAEICTMATPLVVHRAGSAAPDFRALESVLSVNRVNEIRRQQVEMPATPISSSKIRDSIRAGDPWKESVPGQVAEYIEQEGLYAC